MVKLLIRMTLFSLLALTVASCCSKSQYAEIMERVETPDQKNSGTDLLGWEYQKAKSAELDIVHRFYHFPSEKQEAPVIFFVHGLSLDGRCFIQLKELAKDFELIAYNLPESSPYYSASLEDYVPLLNDFFSIMDIDSITMAGVSYGGGVTISYFASPQRDVAIDNVILISTNVFGATEKARNFARRAASYMRRLDDSQVYCIVSKAMERSDDLKESTKTPPINEIVDLKNVDWYRQVMNSTDGYNGIEDAEAIDCPVLIVHGEDDSTIDYDEARENFARHIPEGEFALIPEAKHSLMYENSDELVPLIEAFLKK